MLRALLLVVLLAIVPASGISCQTPSSGAGSSAKSNREKTSDDDEEREESDRPQFPRMPGLVVGGPSTDSG